MLIIYLVIINLIAFLLYGVDKFKAIKGKFRIPERVLILVAVLGGALGAFMGMQVFHHKTKKPKFYITVPVLLVIEVLIIMWGIYQNHHIVITCYDYQSEKISQELNGYKIVQVSDLHNQYFGFKEKKLIDKIKEYEPNIIVVTGDVVDSSHTNYKRAFAFFEKAIDIAPIYFISGNHEKWLEGEKLDEFYKQMESIGVNIIDNEVVEMKDNFYLIGLSDDELDSDMLSELSKDLDNSKLKVLLAHEPAYYKNYSKSEMDLVLTGHVHGGQFIIPKKGGLISPEFEFFPELYKGKHIYGDMTMIISRGLGNSVIPLRINNYPELVLIELGSK